MVNVKEIEKLQIEQGKKNSEMAAALAKAIADELQCQLTDLVE